MISSRSAQVSKRLFDIITAAIGLAALAIPFAAIGIAIKLDSAGPVFFRQVRVGRFGSRFQILKFRSMTHGRLPNGELTTSLDDQVTRIGRYLRATKLDELPQLINVLLGDMSIVGPRPESPRFVEKYSDEDRRIVLSVRPGLTDFASIAYRRENEVLAAQRDPVDYYERVVMPAKLAYCRFYVRRASFLLDLYLIALTVFALGSDAMGGRAKASTATARSGGRQRPKWHRPVGQRG